MKNNNRLASPIPHQHLLSAKPGRLTHSNPTNASFPRYGVTQSSLGPPHGSRLSALKLRRQTRLALICRLLDASSPKPRPPN